MFSKMETGFKAGELILLSSGEYSDYGVSSIGKALIDFDIQVVKETYLGQNPECRERYSSDNFRFINFLETNHYIELLDYREYFLGSYDFEDMEIRGGE